MSHRKHKQGNDPPNGLIKYQRYPEIENVRGFVVNVHDAVNYDIDLELTFDQYQRYNEVISNTYVYQTLDRGSHPRDGSSQITGVAYRCRLKGIGIDFHQSGLKGSKGNHAFMDVVRLINRSNGWVECTVSDVDVYRRILVDIVVPIEPKIHLRDFFLTPLYDGIFFSYEAMKPQKIESNQQNEIPS